MPAKTARIELRLRELAQLFNSMDPSPFVDRDLDGDAEEFIVSWAREHPPGQALELVVHLAVEPPPDRMGGAEAAVRHYFATRTEMKKREFRLMMRRGRQTLLIGLLFLIGCLFIAGLIEHQLPEGTGPTIVRESLTILGWVAMWRPLQLYLYDWWPVRVEQRLFERLAKMSVRVVLPKG